MYQPRYVSRTFPSKSCSRTVVYVLLASIKFCQLKYNNLVFVGLFASLLVIEVPGNEPGDQCRLVYCSTINMCSLEICYIYLFVYLFIYLLMCESFLTVNMFIHLVNAWCSRSSKGGIRFPGTRAIGSYQPPNR